MPGIVACGWSRCLAAAGGSSLIAPRRRLDARRHREATQIGMVGKTCRRCGSTAARRRRVAPAGSSACRPGAIRTLLVDGHDGTQFRLSWRRSKRPRSAAIRARAAAWRILVAGVAGRDPRQQKASERLRSWICRRYQTVVKGNARCVRWGSRLRSRGLGVRLLTRPRLDRRVVGHSGDAT
jgi:hypothetical protein